MQLEQSDGALFGLDTLLLAVEPAWRKWELSNPFMKTEPASKGSSPHVPVFEVADPLPQMEMLCQWLNAPRNKDTEAGKQITELVRTWLDSTSMHAFMNAHPEWRGYLQDMSARPVFCESMESRRGSYVLEVAPDIYRALPEPVGTVRLFMTLLFTNPMCDRLAGPCQRCEKFFVKKRNRRGYRKVCSQRCKSLIAATKSAKAAEERKRKEKLERIRAAIPRWKPRHGDWKRYVALEAHVPITFITRHVNNNNIQPPANHGEGGADAKG